MGPEKRAKAKRVAARSASRAASGGVGGGSAPSAVSDTAVSTNSLNTASSQSFKNLSVPDASLSSAPSLTSAAVSSGDRSAPISANPSSVDAGKGGFQPREEQRHPRVKQESPPTPSLPLLTRPEKRMKQEGGQEQPQQPTLALRPAPPTPSEKRMKQEGGPEELPRPWAPLHESLAAHPPEAQVGLGGDESGRIKVE